MFGYQHFPGGTSGKEPLPANAGDIKAAGSILGLGRSSRGGHGNPFQYSFLENPMDRGAWWAIQSMGSLKSQTRPRNYTTTTTTTLEVELGGFMTPLGNIS